MGPSTGEIAFGGDGAAVGQRGMGGHELLLFVGGLEHLALLPRLTAAVSEILNGTGEIGKLFLIMEFEVVALRVLGMLFTGLPFFFIETFGGGGLKSLMLTVQFRGPVLQTFPLLLRRQSFGLKTRHFSLVLFLQL